jgi:hypothetical protein
MDTVVGCFCTLCEREWEERFGAEAAEDYRDESGALDEDAFFAAIADEVFCECQD